MEISDDCMACLEPSRGGGDTGQGGWRPSWLAMEDQDGPDTELHIMDFKDSMTI